MRWKWGLWLRWWARAANGARGCSWLLVEVQAVTVASPLGSALIVGVCAVTVLVVAGRAAAVLMEALGVFVFALVVATVDHVRAVIVLVDLCCYWCAWLLLLLCCWGRCWSRRFERWQRRWWQGGWRQCWGR